ncbi:MAG: ABC transporter ATPase [Flavobacteriales bacterium]|tara:strand:- start:965 stop:1447 length:483 start_codon:yes stop_codon:yes gene_type:complete
MITSFSEMSKDSRIWIYQSNRKFIASELEELNSKIVAFLNTWASHGSEMLCSYQVKYDRFIIIALDETKTSASGCSIDSCVHFIQGLEKTFEVLLLDKMNVAFKQGEYITYKSIQDFKKLVSNKSVSKKTIVYNNLVVDIDDFNLNWEVPASDSWHSRFF